MKRTVVFVLLFLVVLSLHSESPDYTLTLYTIPAERQMDFASPHRLLWSALENAMHVNFKSRKHAMGHVFVEISGPDEQVFTGSTKEKLLKSGRDEVLSGSGMGILFMGIDGRLEFDEEITKDLNYHYKRGSIAFIEARLSRENYERLHKYLNEYQARGYDAIYNGFNSPREGLGAGCTAFGLSFFEVAGILPYQWSNQWSVSVEVPHRLIGEPINNKRIPLEKLFFTGKWAEEHEASKTFTITDPYLIYTWILEHWQQLNDDTEKGLEQLGIHTYAEAVKRGKAMGILVDFSHIAPPNEPIFKHPEREIYNASKR
jgi:hypothetical protein